MSSPQTPVKKTPDPTPQEAFFFLYILKNLKNKPDVDWEAVARDANFKNGATANARFRQIKQKLGFGTNGATTPSSAKSKKASQSPATRVRKTHVTPRKRTAKEEQREDDPIKKEETDVDESHSFDVKPETYSAPTEENAPHYVYNFNFNEN